MEAKKIIKGQKFIQKGEQVKHLYVLLQGNVQAVYKSDVWGLEPGSIVGILESNSEVYLCDYIALTDCVLYSYDFEKPEDFSGIFETDPKYVSVFVMAAMRQTSMILQRYQNHLRQAQEYYTFLMKMYQEYERFCKEYQITPNEFKRMEIAMPFVAEQKVSQCIVDFYEKMAAMTLKTVEVFLQRDVYLGVGEILNGAGWMILALNLVEDIREYLALQKGLLVDEHGDNLYQRYVELLAEASAEGRDVGTLQENIDKIIEFSRGSNLYKTEEMKAIFEKYQKYNSDGNNADGAESLMKDEAQKGDPFQSDFLDYLLGYAEYEEGKAEMFRTNFNLYKNLQDMTSTSDEVRMLRKKLTRSFYEIYTAVFRKTLESSAVSNGIKMFLNFGFMDAELAGEKVTKGLYDIVQKPFFFKADNVYTIYEWLVSIYNGQNEPSKNEFDLDYVGYLNEQKKTGRISEAQQKQLLQDNWQKVEFEIENMLMSNSRMTYGKISAYCPILCEYDVINSAENMLVTAEKLNQALDYIREIDFSIFYRKVVFSDPARDINMEMIEKEVLPNIILMPNPGSRAMMWQETAGIKKDTPARFMFPILTAANIMEMMIEVAGRYRWEICRKIQGVRWNDITEPSLTSEYNDYIQYYRKNHELSAEAKEKIKNTLYKSKNNFREVFVKDYQNWINYESKGSFRLNKVSREMLFKYCPFAKNIRKELGVNPLYEEMFQKYDISNERVIRRLEMLYERYRKKGGEITKELQVNRDFYDL